MSRPSAASTPRSLRPTVSLVIPALNEAANLPHVLSKISPSIQEVILVDGRSTDDTVAAARSIRSDIRIVSQPGRGKGDALRAGFREATGDIIVMLDADGSMSPEESHDYVLRLQSGYDLVRGSRFIQGGSSADLTPVRWLGNKFFSLLARLLFGGPHSDLCYGFGAFWRDVLPALQLDREPEDFGFEVEAVIFVRAIQHGLRVGELPSVELKRIHGASRLHALRDGWRILNVVVREWTAAPRSQATSVRSS